MDEKRPKRRKRSSASTSSFLRDWGVFLGTAVVVTAFSLWSERHWVTAWLSYLPPVVWTLPIFVSWGWPALRRRKIKWPNVAAQAILFVFILGFRLPLLSLINPPTPSVRLGSLNVERGNARPEAVARWANTENLDVVCFQEANARRDAYWGEVRRLMPGWTLILRREVAVMTRLPVSSSQAIPAPALNREVQVIKLGGPHPFTVINSHWPALPMRLQRSNINDFKYWMIQREACCRQLEAVTRAQPGPVVVAGDFNTPLNAGLFDRIQALGRHAHRSVGWGFAWSYPAPFPITAIDHVVARKCDPVAFHVGPDVGSDHRPVSTAIHIADK